MLNLSFSKHNFFMTPFSPNSSIRKFIPFPGSFLNIATSLSILIYMYHRNWFIIQRVTMGVVEKRVSNWKNVSLKEIGQTEKLWSCMGCWKENLPFLPLDTQ